jgi:hypothetical protein
MKITCQKELNELEDSYYRRGGSRVMIEIESAEKILINKPFERFIFYIRGKSKVALINRSINAAKAVNSVNVYACDESEVSITSGCITATDKSTVWTYGSSKVTALEASNIYAFDASCVIAHSKSNIWLYDSASLKAGEYFFDEVTVVNYSTTNNKTIQSLGNTKFLRR